MGFLAYLVLELKIPSWVPFWFSRKCVIVDHNSKHLIIWLGLGCVVIALCQLTDPKTINISESTLNAGYYLILIICFIHASQSLTPSEQFGDQLTGAGKSLAVRYVSRCNVSRYIAVV